MFGLDYTPAVTLSGTVNKHWSYYTGVFSNATGRDMGQAFGELDSGHTILASVTRDLRGVLGTETAHLNLGYLHSDATTRATNLNRFTDGLNIGLIVTEGARSLVTELTAGLGGTGGSAIALNVQPSVFVTPKLQLVGRYQLAASDDERGLRAQRRYERPAGLDRGELYQAAYLGANYHLAAHRLKLMFGLEYARLDRREVWTTSVAVRAFFGPHSRAPFPAAMLLQPD